jgi:phytoene dehydrogenase-like protein
LSEVAGTVHVIGGGAAGLAAAHALLKLGRAVTLHEGTPGAGGRARALPDGTDNGTHALIGANRAALRFLDEVGGRAGWIEPEPQGCRCWTSPMARTGWWRCLHWAGGGGTAGRPAFRHGRWRRSPAWPCQGRT